MHVLLPPAAAMNVTLLHIRSLHHERRTVQEVGLLQRGHPPPEHDQCQCPGSSNHHLQPIHLTFQFLHHMLPEGVASPALPFSTLILCPPSPQQQP